MSRVEKETRMCYICLHMLLIEKLVFGGQALAHDNPDSAGTTGKAVFVWNALPGEEVEVEYLASKKNFAEAIATKIVTPSPDRIAPLEDHFLSSSPWQMMSWEAENKYKREIAIETYGRNGGLILQSNPPEIAYDEHQLGYRNKIEFSFFELPEKISLAFFGRGSKHRRPVTGSLLAEPVINETAQIILDWINEVKIPIRSLKSLIIRSNGAGQSIAALFIKDKLTFDHYPPVSDALLGWHLYYSTHKSPASVPTELLYSVGQDYLIANILDTKLKFGLLSFFQINIPLFTTALKDMAAFIGPKDPVIDFYSGVGAISLPLARNRSHTTLVESNDEAVHYAQENINLNSIATVEAHCRPAEKMTELIDHDSTIILDPPRAGLHDNVTLELLKKLPPRIAYLSCDISTQARDIGRLSESYKPVFMKLYNFFPRTPHIEGLVVLDRNT